MNRQIKFRVWNGYTINHGGIAINNSTGELEVFKGDKVMQFTGLLDKNGKEIYEGDIIQRNKGNKYEVLEGCSLGAIYIKVGKTIFSELLDEDTAFEVIGNIYENSELIKNN